MRIPYAACVFMELYQLRNGTHAVELYYRRSGILEPLSLSGCSRSCPLDRVMALLGGHAIYEEAEMRRQCGSDTGNGAPSLHRDHHLLVALLLLLQLYCIKRRIDTALLLLLCCWMV